MLPVVDLDNGHTSENIIPSLDYMASLALAWLHAKRNSDSGSVITITEFPSTLPEVSSWPAIGVPKQVIEDAQITLPSEKIQVNPSPHLEDNIAQLFVDDEPPQKSEVPRPIISNPVLQLLYDKWVTVNESDGDKSTGIVFQSGDEYEFEATGSIWPGWWLGATNGPNGTDGIIYNTRYPLHGYLDQKTLILTVCWENLTIIFS